MLHNKTDNMCTNPEYRAHVYICVYVQASLELGDDELLAEEEEVSLAGLLALGQLHTLIKGQRGAVTGQPQHEWTLLHRHCRLLPEG